MKTISYNAVQWRLNLHFYLSLEFRNNNDYKAIDFTEGFYRNLSLLLISPTKTVFL